MPNPTSKLNLVINGTSTQLDIHDANAVDLNSNQTVAGDKEFIGTTTAHDLVPSATDTYNFGSSSVQWNNAYIKSLTINGVACGDILTHNASEFVDVSSAQTIDGQKIFRHAQTGVGRDIHHFTTNPYSKNTPPSAASFQYIWFTGNTASQGFMNSWYGSFIELVINTDGSARGSWMIRNTSDNRMGIQLSESAGGSSSSIIPIGSTVDLGTSTNKWKSFNGLNPGALSLQGSSVIDISSNITALDGTTSNKFTPQINGWLHINGTGTANDGFIYVVQGRVGAKSANGTTSLRCAVAIPVVAGAEVSVTCKLNTLTWANITPCQGNV